MDIKEALKKLGLDQKQTAVYLAALELGEAAMTELAKKAEQKRPTTYLAVEELQTQGLLSETKKGRRKVYSPVHPRRLVEIMRSREQQISDALPELLAIYNTPKSKPKIQVFEGLEGIKSLYRELYQSLSKKEEALWFTRIDTIREHIPEAETEYIKMLKRLDNPKIRELNYGNKEGKQWLKESKSFRGKNHQIRILPTDFEFGASDNLIFGNKLVTFSLKGDVFVIVIESEEIVKTYRALFEWAWLQGKIK
ncbi:MAG: helix-turn-helix domain-containing protein [Candidatus Uhrbacteria bacterium]